MPKTTNDAFPLQDPMSEPEAQTLLEGGVPIVLIRALGDTLEVLNTTEHRDRHRTAAMLGDLLRSTISVLQTVE